MFKRNDKNTYFTHFSTVSIIDFKQVNVSWEIFLITKQTKANEETIKVVKYHAIPSNMTFWECCFNKLIPRLWWSYFYEKQTYYMTSDVALLSDGNSEENLRKIPHWSVLTILLYVTRSLLFQKIRIRDPWESCKHASGSNTLREKSPYTELFLVRIFLHSVRIQENTDQK